MLWNEYVVILNKDFPVMTINNCRPTSVATRNYNCIAWAYGRNDVWCEPDPKGMYFWPIQIREYSIKAYEELFFSIGYSRCDNSTPEKDYQKIALYIKDGKPAHAARQLPSGKWTSKLGQDIDIEHDTPDVLNCETYGVATIFMKRHIKTLL
jgi:hypothetical protein